MPLYSIHHSCALTAAQRQSLASAITALHCSTFSAPSAFVNIVFHTNTNASTAAQIYVSASPVRTNYILGHLRPRPENAERLKRVVQAIMAIWNEHVRLPGTSALGQRVNMLDSGGEERGGGYVSERGEGRLDDERALHNVFLMEDIVAGAEQGFLLPVAGKDEEWAAEHMGEFERRAADGDESMKRLVQEFKSKL